MSLCCLLPLHIPMGILFFRSSLVLQYQKANILSPTIAGHGRKSHLLRDTETATWSPDSAIQAFFPWFMLCIVLQRLGSARLTEESEHPPATARMPSSRRVLAFLSVSSVHCYTASSQRSGGNPANIQLCFYPTAICLSFCLCVFLSVALRRRHNFEDETSSRNVSLSFLFFLFFHLWLSFLLISCRSEDCLEGACSTRAFARSIFVHISLFLRFLLLYVHPHIPTHTLIFGCLIFSIYTL